MKVIFSLNSIFVLNSHLVYSFIVTKPKSSRDQRVRMVSVLFLLSRYLYPAFRRSALSQFEAIENINHDGK